MTATRVCKRCGAVKPETKEHFGYGRNGRGQRYFRRLCRTCHNEQSYETKRLRRVQEEARRKELGNPEVTDPRADALITFGPPVTRLEREVVNGAACKGSPSFATVKQGELTRRPEFLEELLDVCDACPVRAPCREYGDFIEKGLQLRQDNLVGVWGGETPEQRRERRRRERLNETQAA